VNYKVNTWDANLCDSTGVYFLIGRNWFKDSIKKATKTFLSRYPEYEDLFDESWKK
jgi:hypothetical protein